MESKDSTKRKFKVTRFERRGYYSYVTAESADEAQEIFLANECVADGIVLHAHEEDQIEIEEVSQQ